MYFQIFHTNLPFFTRFRVKIFKLLMKYDGKPAKCRVRALF